MNSRPPVGADQPLDRHARAVRAQLVAALPVAHRVDGASAVELRSAFAEPEQRPVAEQEAHARVLRTEHQLLDGAARTGDLDDRRVGREPDSEIACSDGRERLSLAPGRYDLAVRATGQRTVHRHLERAATLDRSHDDADGGVTDSRHDNLDRLAGDDDVGVPSAQDGTPHQRADACGGEVFQC